MTHKTIHTRDLILILLLKELKLRYRNTVLGYAWSLLNPLVFAVVMFFVFKLIIRIQVENYPLFLITGLFPWQWFLNSVNGANRCFLNNASLIKRVYFPRATLVLASVLNDMVHFLTALVVVLSLMLYYHVMPHLSWIWLLPLLLTIQFLLTFGLALAIATANLFFRDLERLTAMLTMILFYLTPIVFDPDMVPSQFAAIKYINPMASLVICWRDLFLRGHVQPKYLIAAMGTSSICAVLGWVIYQSKKWRFAEIV